MRQMLLTTIDDLISNPGRSRHREYLLTTQFVRDVVLAGGNAGYDLLVYLPTVDSDGFDVILDDRIRLLPLQLKSAIEGGKAAFWSVHKTLIWPDVDDAKLYGLDPNWSHHGRAGGVVLVRAAVNNGEIVTRYAYTDIDVLAALWYEVWPLPVAQRRRVDRMQAQLSDESSLKIDLPRSAFLHVATPDHLLALAGLTSAVENGWRSSLRSALRTRNVLIPSGDLDPKYRDSAQYLLQQLVCSPPLQPEPRNSRDESHNVLREARQSRYRMERLGDAINTMERKPRQRK